MEATDHLSDVGKFWSWRFPVPDPPTSNWKVGFIATFECAEPVRSLAKLFSNDKSLRFPLRVVKIFFRIVNFL